MIIEPGQPLETDGVEKLLAAELTAGLEYVYGADNIAAERDRNYDYYRGIMKDLPAPEGRSKVVEPTVANYIGILKPSLLRIFTAGRSIAEYVSPKPELQSSVKLITRFINDVVFKKDNRGELILSDWAEDALVQKLGICMWWWEEIHENQDQILDGIPDIALPAVVQKVQAKGDQIVEHTPQQVVAQTDQGPVPSLVHTLKIRTKINKSKCCIEVTPPEEFIVSRDARTLEDAVLRAHRTGVRVGDLVRAGYAIEDLEDLPQYIDLSPYSVQKYRHNTAFQAQSAAVDPMLKKVAIVRGILKCDYDGAGLKEWYVVAGGDEAAPKLLEIQPYNHQVGFADFCPEPLPHTIYGRCPADRLAGYQKIQTVLVRQANDNVFLANSPQREVVMKRLVKPDQLQNMNPGAPVMVTEPNAIREISIPFVADKALAMIQYYDGQAELTTGVGRMTAGLDPDVLANQSATASNNTQSAQQSRAELIARIWAHGMTKLFRGVFQCIKAYQDFERVAQIDGAPQSIDPRQWQGLEDLDVNINTGLGTGNRERDFALLSGIANEQKEIYAKFGPNNPIADLRKIVRTQQLKAEAGGVSYPENLFGDPVNPDGTPWQPPAPPPPQPSPDAVLNASTMKEIELAKVAQKAQADAADNQLKRETSIAEIASNERVKIAQNNQTYDLGLRQLGVDHAKVLVSASAVDAEQVRTDMLAGKSA